MHFNSLEFIFLYLPITFSLFYLLARFSQSCAIAFLAIASIVFYASWALFFTLLLFCSIVINYTGGFLLNKFQDIQIRKVLFYSFVGLDLGILFYYKYIGFFLSNWNWVFGTNLSLSGIILPIGISFFTFTQIAFLVDVYKGYAKEYNFIHYILFVTYFPHLVAGPILHHQQMMPQFSDKKIYIFDIKNFTSGIVLFIIGLSKKVLLADRLGNISTSIFDSPLSAPEFFTAWKGSIAYSLQLYFDFSGYSDMAVALALMMGISLPLNFDSPYKATSIIDFWRRWHISLSQFLLQYVYIPLGGNRKGSLYRYRNLLITMLLGGLWHGASWNFVIWGGLHGIYLTINHFFRYLSFPAWCKEIKGMSLLKWSLTFSCVIIGWVFFRAPSFAKAMDILKGMFFFHDVHISLSAMKEFFLPTFIISLLIATLMPNSMELHKKFRHLLEEPQFSIRFFPRQEFFQPMSQLIAMPYFQALYFHLLGCVIALLAVGSIFSLTKITYFIYSQF